MNESGMRRKVLNWLRPLDALAVENPIIPGTPDINYIEGWIELKYARAWPKRDKTPFRLAHFTPEQRLWLRRRCLFGGRAFMLLWVDNDWLLFNGEVAAKIVGKQPRPILLALADKHWQGQPDPEGLIQCLKK